MGDKITFQSMNKKELFDFIGRSEGRHFLNFLNQHDVYQFNHEKLFKKAIITSENMNFIDGAVLSVFLSIFNFKKVSRLRGPTFTREFLSNKELSAEKKHFFIGFEEDDINTLKAFFPHLKNIKSYNPPYIKVLKFPEDDVKKMADMINKEKIDFVWVGIGCPKQNILAFDLFKKTTAQYFFNIGAALDFLLGKKKEAPVFVRSLGIEWLYRLVTDFKYTKKKVVRSFIALFYLRKSVKLKKICL